MSEVVRKDGSRSRVTITVESTGALSLCAGPVDLPGARICSGIFPSSGKGVRAEVEALESTLKSAWSSHALTADLPQPKEWVVCQVYVPMDVLERCTGRSLYQQTYAKVGWVDRMTKNLLGLPAVRMQFRLPARAVQCIYETLEVNIRATSEKSVHVTPLGAKVITQARIEFKQMKMDSADATRLITLVSLMGSAVCANLATTPGYSQDPTEIVLFGHGMKDEDDAWKDNLDYQVKREATTAPKTLKKGITIKARTEDAEALVDEKPCWQELVAEMTSDQISHKMMGPSILPVTASLSDTATNQYSGIMRHYQQPMSVMSGKPLEQPPKEGWQNRRIDLFLEKVSDHIIANMSSHHIEWGVPKKWTDGETRMAQKLAWSDQDQIPDSFVKQGELNLPENKYARLVTSLSKGEAYRWAEVVGIAEHCCVSMFPRWFTKGISDIDERIEGFMAQQDEGNHWSFDFSKMDSTWTHANKQSLGKFFRRLAERMDAVANIWMPEEQGHDTRLFRIRLRAFTIALERTATMLFSGERMTSLGNRLLVIAMFTSYIADAHPAFQWRSATGWASDEVFAEAADIVIAHGTAPIGDDSGNWGPPDLFDWNIGDGDDALVRLATDVGLTEAQVPDWRIKGYPKWQSKKVEARLVWYFEQFHKLIEVAIQPSDAASEVLSRFHFMRKTVVVMDGYADTVYQFTHMMKLSKIGKILAIKPEKRETVGTHGQSWSPTTEEVTHWATSVLVRYNDYKDMPVYRGIILNTVIGVLMEYNICGQTAELSAEDGRNPHMHFPESTNLVQLVHMVSGAISQQEMEPWKIAVFLSSVRGKSPPEVRRIMRNPETDLAIWDALFMRAPVYKEDRHDVHGFLARHAIPAAVADALGFDLPENLAVDLGEVEQVPKTSDVTPPGASPPELPGTESGFGVSDAIQQGESKVSPTYEQQQVGAVAGTGPGSKGDAKSPHGYARSTNSSAQYTGNVDTPGLPSSDASSSTGHAHGCEHFRAELGGGVAPGKRGKRGGRKVHKKEKNAAQ